MTKRFLNQIRNGDRLILTQIEFTLKDKFDLQI